MAFDRNTAAMCDPEAVDDREAEPSTLADRLSGEERLENPLPSGLLHAATGITDRKVYRWRRTLTLWDTAERLRRVAPERHADRAHLIANRLCSVDDQVHDDLVQLTGVTGHNRHVL